MERFNSEVRDREKVMRGLKKVDTPILAGYQIYHNYMRPHEGLKGKTPAEEESSKGQPDTAHNMLSNKNNIMNLAGKRGQLIVLNKVGPRECELLLTQIFGPVGCQAYLI